MASAGGVAPAGLVSAGGAVSAGADGADGAAVVGVDGAALAGPAGVSPSTGLAGVSSVAGVVSAGGASSARDASASEVRPEGLGRLAADVCTGVSGFAAATSGVVVAGTVGTVAGTVVGAVAGKVGSGKVPCVSTVPPVVVWVGVGDEPVPGRVVPSGPVPVPVAGASGPVPAGRPDAAGQARQGDHGGAADGDRLRGEGRTAAGLRCGRRRGELAHRRGAAMRARPGVAEGQDVAAQEREARADERASQSSAGEPREGDPGLSVTESDHSGRNIDPNGLSLKSYEWGVRTPESRLSRIHRVSARLRNEKLARCRST